MVVKVEPERVLASLMDLRNYEKLEDMITQFLSQRGWSGVIATLKYGKNQLPPVRTRYEHYYPIREGILRDGMIAILELKDFAGLDVDFLSAFAHLNGDSLEEIRNQAYDHAMFLLGEQVKQGNTFFLDIDTMEKTKQVIYIPDVINARTKELDKLQSSSNLPTVYSTYYGFKLLTSIGFSSQYSEMPDNFGENLSSLFHKLSKAFSKPKNIPPSKSAFLNCSPWTKNLLMQLLNLSLSIKKRKHDALEKLGDMGDSRALIFLHRSFGIESEYLDRMMLKYCIGRIGNPDSFEIIKEHSKFDSWDDLEDLYVIAGIRHPEVSNLVSCFVDKIDTLRGELFPNRTGTGWIIQRQMEFDRYLNLLLEAAGRTRLRDWLPFYKKYTKKYHGPPQAVYAPYHVHPLFDSEIYWDEIDSLIT